VTVLVIEDDPGIRTSLRFALEPDPATPRYVITVRGMGYKLQP
jgi:DNA-binding response OmpR family regulator